MEYKAYLGASEREIEDFYVGGRQVEELWGGNTLLWKKGDTGFSNIFKFEWKDEITFRIAGNGKVKIKNSYGYSTTSQKTTSTREFTYKQSGVHITKLILQSDVNFKLVFVNKKIQDTETTSHYESSLTRILSSIPSNIYQITANAVYFPAPDFAISGSNTKAPYFYEIPEELFKYHKDFSLLDYAFYDSGLKKIPDKLLSGMEELSSVESMFRKTQISGIPENLFCDCPKIHLFQNTFADTNISIIPDKLFSTQKEPNSFTGCFRNTKITRVSKKIFEYVGDIPKSDWPAEYVMFGETFQGCEELQYVDTDFLNFVMREELSYWIEISEIFKGCSKLIVAPKFFKIVETDHGQSTIYPHSSHGAYNGCTLLPWYDEIPKSMK